MKRIITGATGFVGKSLVSGWISQGLDVVIVGRSRKKIDEVFANKVQAMTWEELKGSKLNSNNIECMVNLAGAGIADMRWTQQRKREILESRINATQQALEYCLMRDVPLLNASAIGIYGRQPITKDRLPAPLDEDSAIPEDTTDFLTVVCRRWELAVKPLRASGIRTVNIRLGVVLGKEGGALKKMAMPFYLFAGGPIGWGDQPVSWISLMDVCRAIDFLIEHKNIEGPVNLVAPHCVHQRDLAKALGKQLRRPSFIHAPGFVLRIVLGQMAEELLLNGQHIKPKRLLENHFQFHHPMIEDALKEIYHKGRV